MLHPLEEFDLLNHVADQHHFGVLNAIYDKADPEARDYHKMQEALKKYSVPWILEQQKKQTQSDIDELEDLVENHNYILTPSLDEDTPSILSVIGNKDERKK